MRRPLIAAATACAALVLAAPTAHASTKYEFHDVTFSDGQTGTIYASIKTMKKKPDNVYCGYQDSDHESLGYYLEFVEPAPTSPETVRNFCLEHYGARVQ